MLQVSSGSSSPSSFSGGRSRSAAQPARECSVQPCTSVSVPFVLTVSLLRVTLLSRQLLLSLPGSWGGIVARRSPVVRLAICLPSFPVWRDLLERQEPTRGSHHRVPLFVPGWSRHRSVSGASASSLPMRCRLLRRCAGKCSFCGGRYPSGRLPWYLTFHPLPAFRPAPFLSFLRLFVSLEFSSAISVSPLSSLCGLRRVRVVIDLPAP